MYGYLNCARRQVNIDSAYFRRKWPLLERIKTWARIHALQGVVSLIERLCFPQFMMLLSQPAILMYIGEPPARLWRTQVRLGELIEFTNCSATSRGCNCVTGCYHPVFDADVKSQVQTQLNYEMRGDNTAFFLWKKGEKILRVQIIISLVKAFKGNQCQALL